MSEFPDYGLMENRRGSKRFPVGWQARLRSCDGVARQVQLADVSEEGLRFVSAQPFEPGETVELRVFTSWRTCFRGAAVIVRAGRRSAKGREYGVRFESLSEIDRAILQAGLRALRGKAGRERGALATA